MERKVTYTEYGITFIIQEVNAPAGKYRITRVDRLGPVHAYTDDRNLCNGVVSHDYWKRGTARSIIAQITTPQRFGHIPLQGVAARWARNQQ